MKQTITNVSNELTAILTTTLAAFSSAMATLPAKDAKTTALIPAAVVGGVHLLMTILPNRYKQLLVSSLAAADSAAQQPQSQSSSSLVNQKTKP